MGREIEHTYRYNRQLPAGGTELEPVGRRGGRSRQIREINEDKERSGRGTLFLKQCVAAAIIIFACVMINKSGFEFGKKCLDALGRAVRWDFDFGAAWGGFLEWWNGVVGFWSDVF